MSEPCDLGGRGVLVTRPTAQAAELCRLIETANGRPISFPTIEIVPSADPPAAAALLREPWDLMFFVSRNAVEQALALVPGGTWPGVGRLVAVGKATSVALTQAGRSPDLVPAQKYDTESLLAMPELADMRGRRVLIVRGDGGRALMGDTLGDRGAMVSYAEVYRRVMPTIDPAELLARWEIGVHLAMATSEEVLLNLVDLLGPEGRDRLVATPLVVVAERTIETARRLGFTRIGLASRAEDSAILQALCGLVESG